MTTNYERIKNMIVEEMTDFLRNIQIAGFVIIFFVLQFVQIANRIMKDRIRDGYNQKVSYKKLNYKIKKFNFSF